MTAIDIQALIAQALEARLDGTPVAAPLAAVGQHLVADLLGRHAGVRGDEGNGRGYGLQLAQWRGKIGRAHV